MLKKYASILLLLSTISVLSSCDKEYETIESIDEAKIKAYTDKNSGFVRNDAGFYFKVVSQGTGNIMANSDSVFYDFDIKSLDGTIYQSAKPLRPNGNFLGYITPVPFRIALLGLKRGASVKLIVPSHLAFGKNGSGNIPSNEIIVADINTFSAGEKHILDDGLITNFISKNKLTLTKDASRAYYNISAPGTGVEVINAFSTVTANYTVRYLDGTVLESSINGTFSSRLDQLYKGWRLILPGRVTAGAKLRLILPSDLGGGEPLDFDIEIVKVTN